jgi:5-methylcytosine-specific restriction endonuclease McrA
MSGHAPKLIKQIVISRANNLYEYCQLEDGMIYIPHQIEHIIGLKHGAKTEIENLAYRCFSCNNNKGSDIGTILLPQKQFVRLFKPRIDSWTEHFESINRVFHALTSIG